MNKEIEDKSAKKVLVSGCFDLLHSGHVAFFEEASGYGDLYVAIGSDRTVFELKGQPTVNNEDERCYMVKSVSCVTDAFISSGSGMLDFIPELKQVQPDILIVNEDGNIPVKKRLCDDMGIEYIILKRKPHSGLTARSTTALRDICTIPYRIDLAGGWLDQPWLSELYPGAVITVSIHPTIDFNERSGMASSTRVAAIELWGSRLPIDDPAKLAKILFCYDNPPGTEEISGSQDAIGVVFPGLNKSDYDSKYWPEEITSIQDELTLQFVEQSLHLIPLGPRSSGFSVLSGTRITRDGAKRLSDATEACWQAILEHDVAGFGRALRGSFEAQVAMFPNMVTDTMRELISVYQDQVLGWKVSGAGGGGYLILVSEEPVEHGIQVLIRREND